MKEKEVCIGKMTEADLRALIEILGDISQEFDEEDDWHLALCEVTDRLSKVLREW